MRRNLGWITILVAAGALLAPLTAAAGTLRIGAPNVQGETLTFPIVLDGDVGGGVAAASFRFQYDHNVLQPVSADAGPAASAADKQIQSNVTDGGVVVVMMGLNRSSVSGGEVAQIVMRRVPGAGASTTEVSVTDTSLSDLNATDIPSRGTSETVRFGQDTEQPGEDTGDPAEPQDPDPGQDDPAVTPDPSVPNTPGAAPGGVPADPVSPGTTAPRAGTPDATPGGAPSNRLGAAGVPPPAAGDAGSAPGDRTRGQVEALRGNLPAEAGAAPMTDGREALGPDGLPMAGAARQPGSMTAPPSTDARPDEMAVAALANPGVAGPSVAAVPPAPPLTPGPEAPAPTRSTSPMVWVVIVAVVLLGALFLVRRMLFS